MIATAAGSRVDPDLAVDAISAAAARDLILAGQAPAGMRVVGWLDLSNQSLDTLPPGLHCYALDLRHSTIRTLPADLRVEYRLDLAGCTYLETLPVGLTVGMLIVKGCTALHALPEGLDVYFLDISGCARLTDWPIQGRIRVGDLTARDCPGLRTIPPYVNDLAHLDLTGSSGFSELPEGLRVSSSLDLTGTAIRALPTSLHGARLRWRGLLVDERIVFRPETITAQEVLSERNAELRRIMMERAGYERFMAQAHPKVLDQDRDPGGPRRLLRVSVPGDEDLVCLSVNCPSTGRHYLLRVPPVTRSCRHAAAWIAGFANPDDYRPVAES
jgi:hypothetical protein